MGMKKEFKKLKKQVEEVELNLYNTRGLLYSIYNESGYDFDYYYDTDGRFVLRKGEEKDDRDKEEDDRDKEDLEYTYNEVCDILEYSYKDIGDITEGRDKDLGDLLLMINDRNKFINDLLESNVFLKNNYNDACNDVDKKDERIKELEELLNENNMYYTNYKPEISDEI